MKSSVPQYLQQPKTDSGDSVWALPDDVRGQNKTYCAPQMGGRKKRIFSSVDRPDVVRTTTCSMLPQSRRLIRPQLLLSILWSLCKQLVPRVSRNLYSLQSTSYPGGKFFSLPRVPRAVLARTKRLRGGGPDGGVVVVLVTTPRHIQ